MYLLAIVDNPSLQTVKRDLRANEPFSYRWLKSHIRETLALDALVRPLPVPIVLAPMAPYINGITAAVAHGNLHITTFR